MDRKNTQENFDSLQSAIAPLFDKYDIDNNVDVNEYVKYYDYCLEVGMLNLTVPNYESWCKGCPRIPQEVLDKIQGLRREYNELIKETKKTYNYGKN